MDKDGGKHNYRSGFTLAEVLISLLILAVGLCGVLASFPVSQKFAAECEEDCVATLIFGNYHAIYHGENIYNGLYASNPMHFGNRYFYAVKENGSNRSLLIAPYNYIFSTFPFEPRIYKHDDFASVLYDNSCLTDRSCQYEVSLSRAESNSGFASSGLHLLTLRKGNSERINHLLIYLGPLLGKERYLDQE